MCLRLLAAMRGPPLPPGELERLAFESGLDVRLPQQPPASPAGPVAAQRGDFSSAAQRGESSSAANATAPVAPLWPPVLLELAWGDCACALSTSADGGARVAGLAAALLARGARVQLLLVGGAEPPRLDGGAAVPVSLADLARDGLSALTEGEPAELFP